MATKAIVVEGTVAFDDIAIEDGGSARIVTISSSIESGVFFRLQSWDEDFCNGLTEIPNHPDFERLFGRVEGRKSLLDKPVRVKLTLEVFD